MKGARLHRGLALAVVASLAAWHAAVGATTGLGDAEALYFAYALHPARGYLDHPPLVGWLIGLVTALCGDSAAAVRLLPTLLHAATLAGAWVLAKDCFASTRAALYAVVAVALLPMATVGGVAAAPDAPATALWIWAGVTLGRALRVHRERPGGLRGLRLAGWSAAIGALVGATFLAKYTGLLLVPAALAALLHPSSRGLLRWPGPAVAAGAALLVASPVVVWNAEHGWASVLHRLVWTQTGGPSLAAAAAAVGGQLLYVGPPLLVACGWAALELWRRRGDPGAWLLLSLAAPALLFTWGLCLLSPAAEPHWTAQGTVTLVAAAGGLAAARRGRAVRAVGWAAAGLLAAFLLVLHVAVYAPALPRLLGPDRYEPRYDLAVELRGWPEVSRAVLAARRPGEPVAGSHYTVCSQLVHGLAEEGGRGAARVLCLSEEVDDFDLWGDGSAAGLPSVLYVEDDRFGAPAGAVLPGRDLEEASVVRLRWGGVVVRTLRLVRGTVRSPRGPGGRS